MKIFGSTTGLKYEQIYMQFHLLFLTAAFIMNATEHLLLKAKKKKEKQK